MTTLSIVLVSTKELPTYLLREHSSILRSSKLSRIAKRVIRTKGPTSQLRLEAYYYTKNTIYRALY